MAGRTQSAADVADALGVSTGDVVTVVRWLDVTEDLDEQGLLPDWAVDELHGVLDGPECARSVPEGFLPPEYRLTDEWRALGPGGPDDDPRMM